MSFRQKEYCHIYRTAGEIREKPCFGKKNLSQKMNIKEFFVEILHQKKISYDCGSIWKMGKAISGMEN
jgi:hypothetical protein